MIGSGPAGLAAAQQLTRAGHDVTVFERDDRIGGLLRYGIPDFKMPKDIIDRRLAQMTAEGTVFRVNSPIGPGDVERLREEFDAVVLAVGALAPRELDNPGRALRGVHQAMTYLPQGNRVQAGDIGASPTSTPRGKHVIIIGGGDTAADCLGTANRQGARVGHRAGPQSTPGPAQRVGESGLAFGAEHPRHFARARRGRPRSVGA